MTNNSEHHDSLVSMIRDEYRIEMRSFLGSEETPWLICKASSVVSRHKTQRAAKLALTRLVNSQVEWLTGGRA